MRRAMLVAVAVLAGTAWAFFPPQNPIARPTCLVTVYWDARQPAEVVIGRPVYFGYPLGQCNATEVQALTAAVNGISHQVNE